MRPCGGFTPDMINFAHSTNVYKIWADMLAFDHSETPVGEHNFCAFAGRRDGKNFALSDSELMQKYYPAMRMTERIPDALADAMGNRMYVAVFPTTAKLEAFYRDALAEVKPAPAKKAAKPAAKGKKPAAKAKKAPAQSKKPTPKPVVAPAAKTAAVVKEPVAKPAVKAKKPAAKVKAPAVKAAPGKK